MVIVCPMIFMLRWRSFNEKKYTHLWKSAIEINESKNTQDTCMCHWHIIIFYLEKVTGTKTDSWRRFIMWNVYIFSPFESHSEYLAKFFNVIIRVLSSLLQCKILIDLLFQQVGNNSSIVRQSRLSEIIPLWSNKNNPVNARRNCSRPV